MVGSPADPAAEKGRPLRIVHCFRSPVGGIFRHVRDLLDAQVDAGHAVGIVCDSSTGGAYEERMFEAIRPKLALGLARVEMQRHVGPGDVRAAWRTFNALKALQPDVLHGHGAKGGVYARAFGTFMRGAHGKTARLYSPHGGSLHYDTDTLAGRLFFNAERILERATDRLMFVADYERRTYQAKIGAIRAPHEIIYNGLQPSEFDPVFAVPGAADFLYIGMMRDLKGPDLFLDALAQTEKAVGRPLNAVMVGAGDDLPHYKAQAARLGFGARVTFHDPMPARQAFALARLVVVPSRAEAMPYIVLETLAAGKPMMATAVGGVPEIFGADTRGLMQPEVASIAANMTAALDDEAAWMAAMPSAGTLKARFGADVMAAGIERAYFSALRHRNGVKAP
ncbi:MAG: glycosyltransferase family 4 protein [Rhizobiaceae bacterium]|nr:glycosyltransferase family 4 protein [Rhizobiaceae bacterium]